MATFTVTNTNDSGPGSLRQAVADAGALAGADRIEFDPIVFAPAANAKITLDSGLNIAAGNNVTISGDTNGDGDIDVTISSSGSDFVLLDVGPGATVVLDALRFSGIEVGNSFVRSPLVNNGNLTINGSHFSENAANEFFDNGFSGTGAITNSLTGTLTIIDSAFTGNRAEGEVGESLPEIPGGNGGRAAGAILNLGVLTLAHTLITGNTATGGTGGNGSANGLSAAGYNGGNGGDAAGAILNFGTVSGSMAGANTATGGAGGAGGVDPDGNGAPGQAGAANNGLLNIDDGAGSFTVVNLGTMGTDTIEISSGTVHGLGGRDFLTANGGGSLFGGAGNDDLTSLLGVGIVLDGGLGNDTYHVFSSSAVIQEDDGEGFDMVGAAFSFALAADDHIEDLRTDSSSGTNNINLTGNAFVQTITGNNGNNILNGGVDNVEDTIFGLAGNDTYVLGGSLLDTIEDTAGTDTILSTITRDLNVHADIENLSLKGTGNINATGNALANKINGNIGKNDLIGNIGNDTLNGGDGNDRLKGGAGFDVMNGGKGVDLATFSDQTTRVIISLKETGTTTAFIKGVAADSLTAIENLNGGSGNDVFKGNSLANTFNGNAGNDNLNGGLGNDILTGGIGADTFRFTNVNFGRDRITDFSDNLDKLSFSTGVADSFRDFRITGNGSKSVLVTLGDDTITVQSTKVITLTASDFLFE